MCINYYFYSKTSVCLSVCLCVCLTVCLSMSLTRSIGKYRWCKIDRQIQNLLGNSLTPLFCTPRYLIPLLNLYFRLKECVMRMSKLSCPRTWFRSVSLVTARHPLDKRPGVIFSFIFLKTLSESTMC